MSDKESAPPAAAYSPQPSSVSRENVADKPTQIKQREARVCSELRSMYGYGPDLIISDREKVSEWY